MAGIIDEFCGQENFNDFVGLFSLTKTIRMELVPYNENAKHLVCDIQTDSDNAIERARTFANNYVIVKKILDNYYRQEINNKLLNYNLNVDNKIGKAFDLFLANKTTKETKLFDTILKDLRGQVVNELKSIKEIKYDNLINLHDVNGEKTCLLIELIKKDKSLSESEKEKKINAIKTFDKFAGFFSGYKENRNNMFSDKTEMTAIANRLINENMIFYFENCFKLEKIKNYALDLYNALCEILHDFVCPTNYGKLITQDAIEGYNTLIGHSFADKYSKGCNQIINEYRINHPDLKKHIPFLNRIYNQILFRDKKIENNSNEIITDKELFERIDSYTRYSLSDYLQSVDSLFNDRDLFSEIYFLPNKLNILSQILFEKERNSFSILKKKLAEKNIDSSIPVTLENISLVCSLDVYEILKCKYDQISSAIKTNLEHLKPILLLDKLNDDRSVPKLGAEYDKGGLGFQQIGIIQHFFNSVIELNRFVQLFSLELNGKEVEIENKNFDFYHRYCLINEFKDDFSIYLKVKDYLTRKPYSNDKVRVYFENNSYFLNGFVESRTEKSDHGTQYGGYLFRKLNSSGDYDYFLGCSKNAKLFREHLASSVSENDKSTYERFYYYQLKTQTIYYNYRNEQGETYEIEKQKLKDVILQATKENGRLFEYDDKDTPTNYLNKIERENQSLYKAIIENENVKQLQLSIIKNLKFAFEKYVSKVPALKDILDKDYQFLKDFNDDIQEVSNNKIIYYAPVSQQEWESVLNFTEDSSDKGKFYLFKIQNKDLKDKSNRKNKSGIDNLHTLYFKTLMSEHQHTFDIGAGMVFFREKNYRGKKIIHQRNKPIQNKTPNYSKLESLFEYDIVKDKRYFENKFFLHLSMMINYSKSSLRMADLNTKVNKFIYNNKDSINIMGIDRGERNLIYITIIDQKGNILLQKTMNNLTYMVKNAEADFFVNKDYHKLLSNRVKERDVAKKNWGTIDSIKELKEGYLSQVVHEIVLLMMRYNAIIVMEDLNPNFKRSRINIESQIYQKFEKALTDKLNYLVLKKDEVIDGKKIVKGDVQNGLQLTCPVPAIKDMKNQNGFIFYVWPQYTSQIDPITGFVSLFDTRAKNIEGYLSFFKKFSAIRFNGEDFEFTVDNYQQFCNQKDVMPFNSFVITSRGVRLIKVKKGSRWETITVEPTKQLYQLFENKIDIYGDIRAQITDVNMSSDFYYELMLIFKSIVQLRSSKSGDSSIDYILSPILLDDGTTFDSYQQKILEENGERALLPIDADANGAYHIALKGLMALDTITSDGKIKISNKNSDWFMFIQKKDYKK